VLLGMLERFAGGACAAWCALFVQALFSHEAGAAPSAAPEVATAWKEVLRLDAGPPPALKGEAKETYGRHLAAQEQALRRVLALLGAEDGLLFEARFRLARVLALRAELEADNALQGESDALLDALEKGATHAQQGHIAFTRISQWMRRNRFPDAAKRKELLAAAREFGQRYPNDIRAPRLLVEVATQFDREPEVKRSILADAGRLTKDPELTQRIGDEMRKLGLLSRKLEMGFSDIGGRPFKMEQQRGRPLVLLYFSEASTSSLTAWKTLNDVLSRHSNVVKVAVSLDESRAAMDRARQPFSSGWTVAWDGLGWGSPLARRWGINALPTVWLVDSQGKLASLNALEDLEVQLRELDAKH
jgi:hypothetical protein